MEKAEEISRPVSIKSLKKELISRQQALDRVAKIAGRSDYECAVIAAALIEQLIRLALITHFAPTTASILNSVFDSGGISPLGTFSNKIKMAQALGIFDAEIAIAANLIKEIRNLFSHYPDVIDFANDAIAKECEKFSPKIDMRNNVPNLFNLPMSLAKRRYLEAVIFLAATLSTYTVIAEEHGKQMTISFELAGL